MASGEEAMLGVEWDAKRELQFPLRPLFDREKKIGLACTGHGGRVLMHGRVRGTDQSIITSYNWLHHPRDSRESVSSQGLHISQSGCSICTCSSQPTLSSTVRSSSSARPVTRDDACKAQSLAVSIHIISNMHRLPSQLSITIIFASSCP